MTRTTHVRTSLAAALVTASAAALSMGSAPAPAANSSPAAEATMPPIRALLITGYNNHNWEYTSRVHAETLEATGRFDVDITDDPWTTLADAAALQRYQVFILDYNDFHGERRWGEAADANFIQAVRGGTGVVSIHSANNAFKGWADYERMMVLLWREGTGHGHVHEFMVELIDREHPVLAGMADFSTRDELYHKLVNSQDAPYRLLARAFASKESGGTGAFEPMAIETMFGEGRVFATPLGHVWPGAEDNKTSVTNLGFRTMVARAAEWAATGSVTLPPTWADVRAHNTLTPEEVAEGWTLLFDGTNPPALRTFRGEPGWPTKSWTITDGTIHRLAGDFGPGCRDLITTEQFGDFEFSFEFKVSTGGNSGVMYRATEEFEYPWRTGLEFQVLDNLRHRDGQGPKTRTGSLYDLVPPAHDVSRPDGVWQHGRIVARGSRIEHYLNGFKVVDIDLASDAYREAHAASKWPSMPEMGTRARGHIALQDHGDEVWYRNLKVRVLQPTQGSGSAAPVAR